MASAKAPRSAVASILAPLHQIRRVSTDSEPHGFVTHSFARLPWSEPLWVWKAWDRASGRLVDWECGGRDKATGECLIARLRRWRTRLSCADDYAAYGVLLPVGQLHTGKDETHGIERDNARQRHWLARFRRRSIVVSKAQRMVDVSIALFARFAGNDRIGDLISMLA